MTSIKRFEDLECWQEARIQVKVLYGYTKKDKFAKDFEPKNQVRRSGVYIMANIAEGFHRSSNKDFMKFLDYSRAPIAETLSHCYVALDQNYLKEIELGDVKRQSELIWRKINNLISYLRKHTTVTKR
jgi:four helix bundle protein